VDRFETLIYILSAIAAFALSALAVSTRRLGPGSWRLALFLVPSGLASISLVLGGNTEAWSELSALRASNCLLILGLPGALFFSQSLSPAEDARGRRRQATLTISGWSIALLLVTGIASATSATKTDPSATTLFGLWLKQGWGFFLLALAGVTLAHLERAFREAEEHIRWEIKFTVIGLAMPMVGTVYLSTHLLTYSGLFENDLRVATFVLLPSCALLTVGWLRGSGRGGVRVSQGLTCSTLTFAGVGFYLMSSGGLAAWTTETFELGVNSRALLVILLVTGLVIALSSTRLRHRFRDWTRRHVFSGRYDYRDAWLRASRSIRTSDSKEVAAAELSNLVEEMTGSLEISVWLRVDSTAELERIAARGALGDSTASRTGRWLDLLPDSGEPISRESAPCHESIERVFDETGAALLVPLCSNDETIGLLTVGPDHSGRPFDWNASEFLRVLARHAGSEFHKSELLDRAVQAKEDEAFRAFSTFLLHDLKNFATTLSMVASNAVQHEDNPEFRKDAFASIFDTAEKMKRLCGSLKTFSTYLGAERLPNSIDTLVHAAVSQLAKTSSCEVELCLDAPELISVDAQEIESVVLNLLLNAAQASTPEDRITVETKRCANTVELLISDEGCGIPEDYLTTELFTPFRTTKSDGLGIGLFQCRKIVEAHGGTIDVMSEVGTGTTVSVSLPTASTVENGTPCTERPEPGQKLGPRSEMSTTRL